MSDNVYIISVSMTKFGKYLDQGIKCLTGEALRQVNNPRIAMAENGGGTIGLGEAAMCIHILERTRIRQ